MLINKSKQSCTSVAITLQVLHDFLPHWRRCVGQHLFWAALSGLTLQMLALVVTLALSKNWTRVCYAIKVLKELRLPIRSRFRKDVYVGYADADWELACLTLPACLR